MCYEIVVVRGRGAGTAPSEYGCPIDCDVPSMSPDGIGRVITSGQMRAARALLRIDQRRLADLSGLSLPTIQRMEGSKGVVRGNVDSLMKLIRAFQQAGVELINEGAISANGGRGVRLLLPDSNAGQEGGRQA